MIFKKIEDVGVVIQARLSSERCKNKMSRKFANSTLIDICLKKLISSCIPNSKIWFCAHEQELIEIASKYPINIFKRSKISASSEGEDITEIFEWWDKLPLKYIVMVNACVPFLKMKTIEDFYKCYLEIPNTGAFGVIQKKNYMWDYKNTLLTGITTPNMNTKKASLIKEAAHCLYASSLESIGKSIWMGDLSNPGEVALLQVPEDETLDIDYEWQFDLYQQIYSKRIYNLSI